MAEDFAVSVAAYCDWAGDLGDACFRAIGEEALAAVKRRTPVKTGNLRAGWQCVSSGEAVPVVRQGVEAAGTLGEGAAAIAGKHHLGTAIGAASTFGSELADGKSVEEAGVVAAAQTGGQILGGTIGAALGTYVLPGAGTAVGRFIGSAVGGTGAAALARIATEGAMGDPKAQAGVPPDLRAGDTLTILNPVAYARAVNYGRVIERKDGGVTRIEGRAMVEQTIAELPELAAKAVARVVRAGGGG